MLPQLPQGRCVPINKQTINKQTNKNNNNNNLLVIADAYDGSGEQQRRSFLLPYIPHITHTRQSVNPHKKTTIPA